MGFKQHYSFFSVFSVSLFFLRGLCGSIIFLGGGVESLTNKTKGIYSMSIKVNFKEMQNVR